MSADHSKRTLVLAHRGASDAAPENTIAAFLRARYLGADGIELDVTLTSDHIPIVIHDDTVDRTTNGSGAVGNMTLTEIKRLDAGGWKDPIYRGETIPTLEEVFRSLEEWVRPTTTARRGVINIELKSERVLSNGVERKVVDLVAKNKLQDSVIVSSFNPLALARVRRLNSRLARGLLYDFNMPIYLRRAWLRFLAAPQALHPHHRMIDASYVLWASRRHYSINTWTVDDPGEALRLAGLGVNALITNKPDLIQRALADG
jgi:glycerophosphoryl diester phosphodiesterase